MKVVLNKTNEIDVGDVNGTHFVIAIDKSGNRMQLRQDVLSAEMWYGWYPVFSSTTGTDYTTTYNSHWNAITDAIERLEFQVFAFESLFSVIQFIAHYGEQK